MLPLGSIDIKGVKQRSNSTAAWMILGASLHALVHVKLVIQLLPQGRGVDKQFKGNATTAAIIIVINLAYRRTGTP